MMKRRNKSLKFSEKITTAGEVFVYYPIFLCAYIARRASGDSAVQPRA